MAMFFLLCIFSFLTYKFINMKGTITMLVVLVTLLTTWLSLALLGWAFSDVTTPFKACATHGGTLMVMLIFGWIPSVVVATDLDEYFDNNNKKW